MLSGVVYWIFNISIIGTAAGLFVLLLRRIKVLPRRLVFALWLVPFIRLIIPVAPSFKYSLLNLVSRYGTKTVVINSWSETSHFFTVTNSILAAKNYFPLVYKTDITREFMNKAAVVWIVGVTVCLILALILYCVAKVSVAGACHLKENIYTSSKITAPAASGIFKLKIIIPESFDKEKLPSVLLHEQAHIRRKDNLWRVVAIMVACVHWFNPFVWVFLRYFFADMEFACDSTVLKKLDNDGKKQYALAVLSASQKNSPFLASFGGAKTRQRIMNILSYRKITVLSALAFLLFAISLAFLLLTNAV